MGSDDPLDLHLDQVPSVRTDDDRGRAALVDAGTPASASDAPHDRAQDVWIDALKRLVDARPDTVDREIERALVRAGRLAGADRCYVFQHSADRRSLIVTHEWSSPGSPTQTEAISQIDESVLPSFFERLRLDQEVYVPDARELGEDERIERVVLVSHGVVATLLEPMTSRGEFIGFVGFDSTEQIRYWTAEERATLQFVADLIAGVITRTRVESRANVLSRSLEQSPVGVAIYNRDGRVEWINPAFARMSGHAYDELVDRTSGSRPFGLGANGDLNEMLGVVLSGGVWESEMRMPNAGGLEVALHIRMFEVEEPHAASSRIVCLLEDITAQTQAIDELRQAQTDAERASAAKGRFLKEVSTGIDGASREILDSIGELQARTNDPVKRRLLASIEEAALRLGSLAEDALDFTRIESGGFSVAEDQVDVREVIEATAQHARELSGDASTREIRVRIDEGAPRTIVADETLLRQALGNLVDNAVKYTPTGLIEVGASVDNELAPRHIDLRVADTGVGVEPERLESVFEPYEPDGSDGSTGLGLAIAQHLVRAMGGEILADSQPGSGSTFTVRLPLQTELDFGAPSVEPTADSAEHPVAGHRPDAPQLQPTEPLQATLALEDDAVTTGDAGATADPGLDPAGSGIRLLVADDSADSVRIVTAFLRPIAERIDSARDGLEAVELARSGAYDLILMDMQMRVMDGYAATAAIRALDEVRAADTPIVALTAYALAEEIGRAIAAGCDGYLTKPIRRADLMHVVEKYARATMA